MSYLVLVLAMQANAAGVTSVTMKLDVDVESCQNEAIPAAKKQYVNSPLNVVSARCFPVKY